MTFTTILKVVTVLAGGLLGIICIFLTEKNNMAFFLHDWVQVEIRILYVSLEYQGRTKFRITKIAKSTNVQTFN